MTPADGLYLTVAGLLVFLAGMLAAAGLLGHYLVRADRRERHAEDVRESLLAADWRAADPESYMWTCTTVRLPVIPVQRLALEAAA